MDLIPKSRIKYYDILYSKDGKGLKYPTHQAIYGKGGHKESDLRGCLCKSSIHI